MFDIKLTELGSIEERHSQRNIPSFFGYIQCLSLFEALVCIYYVFSVALNNS